MFLRSNTYAVRPSLCVGIPLQLNSLTGRLTMMEASISFPEPAILGKETKALGKSVTGWKLIGR
jgi:hypothetical protein